MNIMNRIKCDLSSGTNIALKFYVLVKLQNIRVNIGKNDLKNYN